MSGVLHVKHLLHSASSRTNDGDNKGKGGGKKKGGSKRKGK